MFLMLAVVVTPMRCRRNPATEISTMPLNLNVRSMAVDAAVVTAAIFAGLTYYGQRSTDQMLANIQASTEHHTNLTAEILERNIEQLKFIARMLPETERTRLGVERLIETSEEQWKAIQLHRPGTANDVQPDRNGDKRKFVQQERKQPQVGGWSLIDPEAPWNKKAREIWHGMRGKVD